MSTERPSLAVIGAGAIGGVTVAWLASGGWDPILVCKHAETARLVNEQGLAISGLKGQHRVKLRAVERIDQLPGPQEIIFIATKATDLAEVAAQAEPFLMPRGMAVSLQNGICEEALAQVVGPLRTVGCVVGWGATMLGPGRLEITSPGEFVLGCLEGRPEPRLEQLAAMLGALWPTRITTNILGELYAKLIINACINTLGAASGLVLGQLLARRDARRLFVAVMREAMAVAAAMGLKVAKGGGGKLDYYAFLAGGSWWAGFKRNLTIRVIGFKYRRIKSSSLQSLERGRPTEIDYLNGYICAKGRELSVPTPVNDALVGMIKEIEAGQRAIDPGNLRLVGA